MAAIFRIGLLGLGQTSNFTWVELNANELKQKTSLIYIEFDCEVRRLTRALVLRISIAELYAKTLRNTKLRNHFNPTRHTFFF